MPAHVLYVMAVDAVAVVLLLAVGGKVASGVGPWQRDLDGSVVLRQVPTAVVQLAAWVVLSGELLLAMALLLAPSRSVLLATGGLFVLFAAVVALEVRGGRAGEPCFCFGRNPKATVSWRAVSRNLVVAVWVYGLAALSPAVPPPATTTRLAGFAATVSIVVCWALWSAIVRTRRLGDEQLAGMGVDRHQLRAIQAARSARPDAVPRTAESGT